MSPDMMIKMGLSIGVVSLVFLLMGIFKDAYQQRVIDQNQKRAEEIRAKGKRKTDEKDNK